MCEVDDTLTDTSPTSPAEFASVLGPNPITLRYSSLPGVAGKWAYGEQLLPLFQGIIGNPLECVDQITSLVEKGVITVNVADVNESVSRDVCPKEIEVTIRVVSCLTLKTSA